MHVACLHIPNFIVALARRERPELRRRPVVIGGSPEEHAQVTACSDEAAAAGVTIGTTLRRALALCPKAVFLPLEEGVVMAEAERLLEMLQLYSPVIEALGPGHVHMDVRGLPEMTGADDETYLRDLYEAVASATGLPVRLAGADTVFAAHAATIANSVHGSRFAISDAEPVLVRPEGHREFLDSLPVEVLPVSPLMHTRLRLLGLERLGQIAELSFSAMQAQFGREGARAWELTQGQDDSRVVPRREELRLSEEIELPAPATLSEPLVIGTRALLTRVLGRPDMRGQTLRRLDWRLGLESGEQVTRRLVFREPTNDPARMLFVIKGKIERLQLASPAVSMGVTLSGLCSEYGHQGNLWQAGPRRQRELIEAVEQLTEREGGPQVFRILEVQPWSRIPERQLALVAYGA